MKKHFKLLYVLVCALLCTSILLSACLVVHDVEHNCIGDNCRICQAIALRGELISLIMLCCFCGGAIFCISRLTASVFMLVGVGKTKVNLVADKVKLTA